VAGIIGAVGNNNLGIAGVMWTVKLMPLKIFNADSILTGSCVSAFASDEIAAIQYAVAKGAKIINASFHSEGFCNSEFNAISAANTAGVLFVAAAGNGGLDSMGINNDVDPQYPASYNLPNIISVAATDQNDGLASFSNFGPNSVHVAAPGVYILSTVPFAGVQSSFQSFCTGSQFAGYDFCSGTSMAAPHVSGLAGLLYSYYTNFTMNQVRGTIFRYVDLLPSLNGKVKQNGRIDAEQAVTALLTPTNLVATAQSSSQTSLTWTDNATGEDGYDVDRKAPGGSFVRIATLGPNATTFSDSGLTASTAYTYRVRAFNGVPAVSFYSNEASATTPAPDAPPPVTSSSDGGGGGGCSIGVRQNVPTAMIDLGMLLMPLLIFAVLRRRR
jgi:subtilisin family serine protease